MQNQKEMELLLNSYGVNPSSASFSFASIMAYIIFGIIGFCAFNYGRKEKNYKALGIGLALMIYPYFVHITWVLYLIGAGLTAALYFWRD